MSFVFGHAACNNFILCQVVETAYLVWPVAFEGFTVIAVCCAICCARRHIRK